MSCSIYVLSKYTTTCTYTYLTRNLILCLVGGLFQPHVGHRICSVHHRLYHLYPSPQAQVSPLSPITHTSPFTFPSVTRHFTTTTWRPGEGSGGEGSGGVGSKKGGSNKSFSCPRCGEPFKNVSAVLSKCCIHVLTCRSVFEG